MITNIDRQEMAFKYTQRTIFQGSCDIDHCIVVVKVREGLAVSQQEAKKFNVERFNLMKLSELEVTKQYQIKISNRFAALYNLHDSKDMNMAWVNVKDNIKISAKERQGLYEWKQYKPWFDEEYSQYLEQWKQAKMQWLQDPNHSNVDNLNNISCEASRHFRNKN
jgi:hypothetical protein